VRFREPVNNQAGVGKSCQANDDGPRRVHPSSIENAYGFDDAKSVASFSMVESRNAGWRVKFLPFKFAA
jgi:hypothetical protein